MTITTDLLPVGTAVTLMTETFGEYAMTGTIAGHVAYVNENLNDRVEQGYVINLDSGAYLDTPTIPPGLRPWISHIVAHVESVERA